MNILTPSCFNSTLIFFLENTESVTILLRSFQFSSTTVTSLGLHADSSLVCFGLCPSVLTRHNVEIMHKTTLLIYPVAAVNTYMMLQPLLCDLFRICFTVSFFLLLLSILPASYFLCLLCAMHSSCHFSCAHILFSLLPFSN